ncbi:MAG: chemotaxis protein CheW [Desulfuromonadales bacterium]|nr:chemotaxis protein CheW [Desulfuromonadales bacterium]
MNSAGGKYLIFSLPGGLYALELSQVAEVCEPQPLWPVPAAPPYYRGAMNFHGAIVAVMDLADFLGLPKQTEPEKLIVLHGGIAALAFLVEKVIRIVLSEQVELKEATGATLSNTLIVLSEGRATLLDAHAITEQATASISQDIV